MLVAAKTSSTSMLLGHDLRGKVTDWRSKIPAVFGLRITTHVLFLYVELGEIDY